MRNWRLQNADKDICEKLRKETGLSPLITEVMVNRRIRSKADADAFFTAQPFSDPFLIKDMDKAVEIISSFLEGGRKITVFGDYDCDGVTSTVMLYLYLAALGGDVDWYIPSRDEGYGLNNKAIEKLADNGTELIITVDNGISAVKEAEFIKDLGLSLIITDHHQAPDILPAADAIIDPHRPHDMSPFKDYAGCGVVLKLITALEGDEYSALEQFADLAAIGTIGDIVPLIGENREIVKYGLEAMSNTDNMGIYQLIKQCNLDPENISSTSVAFGICPRINAAGRFASASKAVELLLTENTSLANTKAIELTELNKARQQSEQEIIREIDDMIMASPKILSERVIVIIGNGWSHGVIGIVSSRILQRYGKPNLIITVEGDTARGSARSIEGFSLYKMLTELGSFLVKFGGHTKAAGFTINTDMIEGFKEAVHEYSRKNFSSMPRESIYIDKKLNPADLEIENVKQLSILAPYGEMNSVPIFLMENCTISAKRSLKDGKYLSFNVTFGGKTQKILSFIMSYNEFQYEIGDKVHLLVNLDVNEYNDIESIQATLKDIRPANFSEEKFIAAENTYERIARCEEIDERLLKRIIPNKDEIKTIYDLLRSYNYISSLTAKAAEKGINYCMLRVILDVFDEFKLIDRNIITGAVSLRKAKQKVDIESSVLLKSLLKNK